MAASDGPFIQLLTDSGLLEPEVGAKAVSLGRLSVAGLPVPAGFCLSARAYREHLWSGPVADSLQEILAKVLASSAADRPHLLADFRQAIVDGPISSRLVPPLESAYRALGAERVAVRSSATSEDLPHHSFAGLYDSYLGVGGVADLLLAVRKCWASLWTDRAFDYREKNHFDHRNVAMAVIVQELVPAETAGIAFTADPLSGRQDRLIIEGSFGLGEAIVSGKVTPDRVVLARDGLRVLEHTVAEKAIEVVVENDGVVERALSPARASSPCLDEASVHVIAELALRAERLAGSPQDVEWAMARQKVFILQSRPITTLPVRTFEDRQIWSNLNSGEVLPDVTSPMTWSSIEFLIGEIFGEVTRRMGLDLGEHALIGRIAGRGYFNLNTFAAIFRGFPGWRRADPDALFGGAPNSLKMQWTALSQDDLPTLKVSRLRLLVHLPGLLLWLFSHSTYRGLQFAVALRRKTAALERRARPPLTEKAILEQLRSVFSNSALNAEAIAFGIGGVVYTPHVPTICRRWLGDADGSLANRLLAGVGNMDSAEAGLALWRLASFARRHPQVQEVIQGSGARGQGTGIGGQGSGKGEDFAAIRAALLGLKDGPDFLERWDAFMERHGHHTRGEVDVMNPRWRDTPDVVLAMVRSYLQGGGETDADVAHRKRRAERRRLVEECRRHLRNPLKRGLFDFFLGGAERWYLARENIKSEAVRMVALARHLLLLLGESFHCRGVLADREDIFFLTIEELEPVRTGTANFDVRAAVDARRAEYRKNLGITPPAVVIGRFDPDRFVPDSFDADAETLTGLAVSPGVVTGRARVILRSDTTEHVLPGEVLVAPFTDPGWTPYFLQAAAIVMDRGGLLSHGSIIAREYGIPAVVNVGPATRIIQTGQMLHVDGTRGEVRILK
jgi:pyruvate,water dikinase